MSDKAVSFNPALTGASEIQPVLRYAFGATIIMLVAIALNYTLSYLVPVLAISFLAPGANRPSLKITFLFLAIIVVASFSGNLFSRFFLAYPLVFIPLLLLTIFLIYFSEAHPQIKTWFIISLLVIPMISMQSAELGKVVAVNLILNATLAMVLVWLVFTLFPVTGTVQAAGKKPVALKMTQQQRFISASKQLIVIAPVLVSFFVFNWSGAMLVLIFISLLSMNPASANKKTGMALIIANFGGGLAAIVAFNLLTVVPEIIFMGLLTLLTGLIFGSRYFGKKPLSPLYGTAFSTFLLVLGNVTTYRGEAGEMVWARIFQLGIVVVYIVVAFGVVNHFISNDKNQKTHDGEI